MAPIELYAGTMVRCVASRCACAYVNEILSSQSSGRITRLARERLLNSRSGQHFVGEILIYQRCPEDLAIGEPRTVYCCCNWKKV